MRAITRDRDIEILDVPYKTDEFNSLVPDLAHATTFATGKGSLQPFLSIEDDIDRDTTSQQWRLITDDPNLYGVTATYYARINSTIYRIDGEPFVWTVRGKVHHVEFNLQLIEG